MTTITDLDPPKPNRQIESMTKLRVLGMDVRIWRTESSVEDALDYMAKGDIYTLAAELKFGPNYPSTKDIAEAFAKLDRVAAVEVLSQSGQGVIIYPDWH